MTNHTTYVCGYCGKVFGNEDTCLRHEWEHRFELLKNHVKFMEEENGVFIELPLTYESVDECNVIYYDGTNEAWDTLAEAYEQRGYEYPAEDIRADGHIFIYDYDMEKWFCLEKKLNHFVELNTEVSKIIEGK